MLRFCALLLIAALGAGAWIFLPSIRARVPDAFQKLSGDERIAQARTARAGTVRDRLASAGVAYPPREIFLRAFKQERELELWARSDEAPLRHVTTFAVLASSGNPRPKRREGDRQVPEGFYVIDRFNPESRFHLSLGLNYPNASDRMRSDPDHPGGDIFIHGKNVSIGCLAIGDPAIEELFLIALAARDAGQAAIAVHIFPARMAGPEWERFRAEQLAKRPELESFWAELHAGYDAFERTRRVPEIEVLSKGEYRVKSAGNSSGR